MSEKLITEKELADRWSVSRSTLNYQRQARKGCPYIKLPGGAVRYRISDIEKIEQEGLVTAA